MPNPTKSVAPTPSEVFVRELQEARQRAHLTQQQLADRLEALGSAIDRSTIGKIEAGKRGVSLDELFTFATALGVSPLSLVVPRSGRQLRIAPGLAVDTADVLQWARNFRPLAGRWMEGPDLEPLILDGAGVRAFYESISDSESEAYRRYVHLQSIVQGVSTLMLSAMDSNAAFRKRAVRGLLARLALDVQRAWEDIGEKGQVAAVARSEAQAVEAAMEEITSRMYADMERKS
jgi:transcriptional regulator with XRE-family HTH domain